MPLRARTGGWHKTIGLLLAYSCTDLLDRCFQPRELPKLLLTGLFSDLNCHTEVVVHISFEASSSQRRFLWMMR